MTRDAAGVALCGLFTSFVLGMFRCILFMYFVHYISISFGVRL
jgi:hypothetical protein